MGRIEGRRRPGAGEVAPGVWHLPLRGVNAYALATRQGTVLVDAGNPGDGPRILSLLDGAGVGPPRLILLTHGDVDHAGGVRALVRLCAATVMAPEAEALMLAGGGRPRLLRRLSRLLTGRIRCAGGLAEGLHAAGLAAIPTPGHTRGHCSFWRGSDGVLFAGDALSVHDGAVRIPRRPFTEDRQRALASLTRLAGLRPRLLLPGHGTPLPDPADALEVALAVVRGPRHARA